MDLEESRIKRKEGKIEKRIGASKSKNKKITGTKGSD